ncbi:hypothetical protein VPHD148_0160 [Vibrio phage D148]
MAKKKKKLSPVQQYIAHEVEWAAICRETVYGKKVGEMQIFNFDLDNKVGDQSGTYRAYQFLAMAEKSERIVEILGMNEVQERLDVAAKEHGYGTGQQLLMKSMNWDEKAQALRNEIFKEYL